MSEQQHSPNRPLKSAGSAAPALTTQSAFVHPDYSYWACEWEKCRDVFVGEKAVKGKAQQYLPRLESQNASQYNTYISRAVFYNMTARTVNGLLGTVFRRDPKFLDMPKSIDFSRVTLNGESLKLFLKRVSQEVITVGRYGVLVDRIGEARPYLAGYVAENILDWETEIVDGVEICTMVLLREVETFKDTVYSPRRYRFRYRRLVLTLVDMNELRGITDPDAPVDVRMVYQQHIYFSDPSTANQTTLEREPDQVITPTNRGEPFDRIPFWFFGPHSNDPQIEKPPLLDIVDLNLKHFLNYAELSHGRFHTAQPIYYVQTGDSKGSYVVGPDVVWEVEPGNPPGILEYNGHGLRFLENALKDLEDQVSAIGGRFMTQSSRGAAESDNTLKMKEANERSLLINLVAVLDEGASDMIRFWMMWQDVSPVRARKARIEMNQDFLFLEAGAREFRAVAGMWKDGQLPGELAFDYFKRFEVIPDWVDFETFKRMMEDPDQFTNQVDALARQRGYPSAQSELDVQEADKDREHETELTEDQQTTMLRQAEIAGRTPPGGPPNGG